MTILIGALIGGLLGLALLNVMALIARSAGNACDTLTFSSNEDIVGKVDAWAKSSGYRVISSAGGSRRYQKGYNFLTAPMFLDVVQNGMQYTLKSYVQINGLIVKGDMALSASGFMVKLPRAMAKKAHNQLRAELGQPLLQ
ncbi:MAG TPA: hypothetical protein VK660_01520 [Xanthomonadaceae bacterium]|jgi:hypothetical protein|nr:hypothetical protein [Xanthomonadaceae bacterium]